MPNDILTRLADAVNEDNGAKIYNVARELVPKIGKRIFEMPCEVGDTVYCVFAGTKKIVRRTITGFAIKPNTIKLLESYNDDYDGPLADMSAIGKTVFLTLEQAEAALAVRRKERR